MKSTNTLTPSPFIETLNIQTNESGKKQMPQDNF